jgi:hypothetical protein
MLVSARQAASIMWRAGVNRDRSRRLLEAGFAGGGVRTTGSLLFEHDRVQALAAWSHVESEELVRTCPDGVYVARLGPDAEFILDTPWDAQIEVLSAVPHDLSAVTRAFVRSRIQSHGLLPWVATVCGFVAVGADLEGFRTDAEGESSFVLARPGHWFETLCGRRFETGPGRPWSVWGWQP